MLSTLGTNCVLSLLQRASRRCCEDGGTEHRQNIRRKWKKKEGKTKAARSSGARHRGNAKLWKLKFAFLQIRWIFRPKRLAKDIILRYRCLKTTDPLVICGKPSLPQDPVALCCSTTLGWNKCNQYWNPALTLVAQSNRFGKWSPKTHNHAGEEHWIGWSLAAAF